MAKMHTNQWLSINPRVTAVVLWDKQRDRQTDGLCFSAMEAANVTNLKNIKQHNLVANIDVIQLH